MTIQLAQANQIIKGTIAEGRRLGLLPLCVAVVDMGGHLIALAREDSAHFLRPRIATAKAAGCAGTGLGGSELGRRAMIAPGAFAGLIAASDGNLVGAQGGVVILDSQGLELGAVGVSGDASDADEACAVAGIAAAGLVARTGT